MATEMSLRVGHRIRQRREELGIRTQRELADLIPVDSVTNQTINKWEKGANEPSPRYKTLLAAALGVDVAYFIAEEPKGKTPDLFPAGQDDRLGAIMENLAAIKTRLDAMSERQSRIEDMINDGLGQLGRALSESAVEQADRIVQGIVADVRSGKLTVPPPRSSKAAAKRAPKSSRVA